MAISAVTGDIGAGKSTVSKLLAEKLSCDRLDADSIIARLWTMDDVKAFFLDRWGDSILDMAGSINKSRVASIIFTNQTEYAFCSKYLHERVMNELHEAASGLSKDLVLEIPLLPEAGRPCWIDCVIYVTADFETRERRCMTQRGWDVNELERRERLLLPKSQRLAISDYVIRNDGSMSELEAEIIKIIKT